MLPLFQDKYLNKYFHLGRDGMKNLLKINYIAALDTIYYKIESNVLYKIISKLQIVNFTDFMNFPLQGRL